MELLNKYTDGSKLENGVGNGIYSDKLALNISLRLPDDCRVFLMDVTAIYRAAQWLLVNDAHFTCLSIFSESLGDIKSLSDFLINSRVVI